MTSKIVFPRGESDQLCKMLMGMETWPLKGQCEGGCDESVKQQGPAGEVSLRGRGGRGLSPCY